MDDILTRVIENMGARVTGPMKFRLVLQPLMASIFAIRSGLADARAGRSPFLWTVLNDPSKRAVMIKDAWKDVGKVFILALVLDVVYQIVATRFVYPGEVFVTAVLLAIVPYIVLRGLIGRIAALKK